MRGSITASCSPFRQLLRLTMHRVAEHHADRIARALAKDVGICDTVAKEAERGAQELGIPATVCSGRVIVKPGTLKRGLCISRTGPTQSQRCGGGGCNRERVADIRVYGSFVQEDG